MGMYHPVNPENLVRNCIKMVILVALTASAPQKKQQTKDFSSRLQILDLHYILESEPSGFQGQTSLKRSDEAAKGGSSDADEKRRSKELVVQRGGETALHHMGFLSKRYPSVSDLRSSNHEFGMRYLVYGKTPAPHNHRRLSQKIKISAGQRYKRRIFPPDNRRRISSYQGAQQFPYSATVKISTGCTGTLISNQHVLTAAHCIHNKTHYITPTSNIRVGFLKSNGKFRWYRVTSVNFPTQWISSKGARYDYAVLQLSKAHKRKYFRLIVPNTSSVHIYFTSFPGDKRRNTMWHVDCTARVLTSSSPSIISQCDAAKGSSGAGIYTVIRRRGKNKRVIIGVLSGTGMIKHSNGDLSYFNKAVSLKMADVRNICRWAGSPRGCPS